MPANINGVLSFKDYGILEIDYQININAKSKNIELSNDNFRLTRNVSIYGNNGQLIIKVELFEKNSNIYPFYLSFIIYGLFTNNGLNKEDFHKVLEFNGTAILFPFIRSTVADITKTANNGTPLLLPTINVNALFKTNEWFLSYIILLYFLLTNKFISDIGIYILKS